MAPQERGCHRKEVVIMRLMLDTSRAVHGDEVSGAEDRVRRHAAEGEQTTNRPEWVVEVLAMDSERGEVIRVTVAGDQPRVSQGQTVTFSELEAIPWEQRPQRGGLPRASIQPSQARAA